MTASAIGILCFAALFATLGILLMAGKGSFLIAGFNTMPKKQREKFDVRALCRFMGLFMFYLSFCMLLWFADEFVEDNDTLFIIGQVLFPGGILFALIYANTGNRFMKKEDEK